MEICDIINTTEEGPQHAAKAIRRKLQQSMGKNSKTALYTLTILETAVKNCRSQAFSSDPELSGVVEVYNDLK